MDDRDALYERALKVADANSLAARKLAYRMRLIQNDLIVDARKDSGKSQAADKGQKQKSNKKQDENSQQLAEDDQAEDEPNLINAD